MSPQFSRSLFYKFRIGTALIGLCLSHNIYSQETPISVPQSVKYPGIIETFEKIIQVDQTKFRNKTEQLIKSGRNLNDLKTVADLDLDPDFLNSIILHSNPGYIKLASANKCRFYDTILTDLLRSSEGKIKNVIAQVPNSDGRRLPAILTRKDFLNKVVAQECPETPQLIEQFQIRTLDKTLASTIFEIPAGKDQCRNIHLSWLSNSKTPYLCQIHEFLKEARNGSGDPKDLEQRRAVAKLIDKKMNLIQKDYLENLCTHLDNEELFCQEFLNVSFWSKVAGGHSDKIYAEDICQRVTGSKILSENQFKQCLARLKVENDLCLYGTGTQSGLSPKMGCDALSLALNHSTLKSDYKDCPGNSDQLAVTNLSRTLLSILKDPVKPTSGPCSAISTAETLIFNEKFDNDENWRLEACYQDKLHDREVCSKTFFGQYGTHPNSYSNVVAGILRATRGADPSTKCQMVDAQDYNPLLLQYKSGCIIIYESDKCYMSQCKHKILFNDRPIDFISLKGDLGLEYFPITVKNERFSQHFLLTRDFKQTGKSINNITTMMAHFKKAKRGIIYGVGCAEDLLPSFFTTYAMNQCTPMPFIIDGIVREGNQEVFVLRSAADSLQAPRLVSWSNIFSSIKSYQQLHPLKLWTLYGLD